MGNAEQVEAIQARISLEATEDTPAYYVNHADIVVGHAHEIAIWFARLPTKPTSEKIAEIKETGVFTMEPEFQILIPPTLLPGLISALQTTLEKYEAQHGQIRGKGQ